MYPTVIQRRPQTTSIVIINDEVIIDEAISDITSHQLEEIKREAEIIQQK
jgi:hypothetical protein